MRKVLTIALIMIGSLHLSFAQDTTDPTELLLNVALTQDEVRQILGGAGSGNDAWVLESKGASPRPPTGSIGVSFVFTQGTQVIRGAINEFERPDLADDFVRLGIDSVLADLSADPVDKLDKFLDPDTEEPLVDQAVLLTFAKESDNQLIFLRINPDGQTAIVGLVRSNLNEEQITLLGRTQLAKLIEAGK